MATNQQESVADGAEAQAVFGLVAQRCGPGPVTMNDCKAIDDDIVTCREDTSADIVTEVEEATGNESDEEIDCDNNQSFPLLTKEASQAVEVLQQDFQKKAAWSMCAA